jgi:hypothetical protein
VAAVGFRYALLILVLVNAAISATASLMRMSA